jgi:HSP20 family protein
MRFDPFGMMRDLLSWDPFQMFGLAPFRGGGRQLQAWTPTFEVRETDDAFVFHADVPGAKNDDIQIAVTGNQLEITGKRDQQVEHDEDKIHTYERSYGSFSRCFMLPETADLDHIRCDLKDGVLTTVVPKKPGTQKQQARKIPVGSGAKQ